MLPRQRQGLPTAAPPEAPSQAPSATPSQPGLVLLAVTRETCALPLPGMRARGVGGGSGEFTFPGRRLEGGLRLLLMAEELRVRNVEPEV